MTLSIIPISEIPKEEDIIDTPLDDLDEIHDLFNKMVKICKDNGGVGLSAIQLGMPWKFFIVRYGINTDSEFFGNYINCDYYAKPDCPTLCSTEGCLSFPGKNFAVNRYTDISILGQSLIVNRNRKLELVNVNYNISDIDSIYLYVFQHEIDHQFGQKRLLCNIGKELP
jgi:peptide deformylase